MLRRRDRRYHPRRGLAPRAWNTFVDRVVSTPRTPLIEAARSGDRHAVEHRIAAGDALDERDARGRTALHHALLGGRAENAACLLAYGADPAALDPRYASLPLLHEVRQRYRRFRMSALVPSPECSDRSNAILGKLESDGIARVSGLVDSEQLERLRGACQAFVDNIDRELAAGRGVKQHYDEEEHWWPNDAAYVTNNAFKYSNDLVALCAHPLLLEVAHRYLGDGVLIQRGVGMRYLPGAPNDRDMFGWHHDMEERRIKIQILLTDVGEADQAMSYVRGSHTLLHPYEMFFRNQCPLAYCRQRMGGVEPEIIEATGVAGDIFIFDSNGAHRGNRRTQGSLRDVFFAEYTTDPSDVWGGDVDETFLAALPAGAALFEPLEQAPKAWERPLTRSAPTWIENLLHPERWLRARASGVRPA